MKANTTTNKKLNRTNLMVVLVVLLFSSLGFAQTVATAVPVSTPEIVSPTNTVIAVTSNDSDMDFMNWFMGSKQMQPTTDHTISNSKTFMARKKQIMSSGVTPNKVLYRTFVKKVISQDNAIV